MTWAMANSLIVFSQADAARSWVGGTQSSLDPAGPQSSLISGLWWQYFWISVIVYAAVISMLLLAVAFRSHRWRENDPEVVHPSFGWEYFRGWIVGASLVGTIAVLFVLLIGDHVVGRALHSLPTEDSVKIRVVGHQWWWEVRYDDPTPSNIFTTANEIHIPVDRTVEFELQSVDVIHSFWIPNLHGKRDMIPARTTRTKLRANVPGTYWGQCAEFCGYQHAKMRLRVVVESQEDFDNWLEAQRKPAAEPTSDSQKKGREVFLGRTCVTCHTIQGTTAAALVGPNLTHVASRAYIASGSLPNTRGHLAGWITNPQSDKPGVRMPSNALPPQELHALLDYLESLK